MLLKRVPEDVRERLLLALALVRDGVDAFRWSQRLDVTLDVARAADG